MIHQVKNRRPFLHQLSLCYLVLVLTVFIDISNTQTGTNLFQALYTPNRYRYKPIKYNFDTHRSIKLEVAACHDAHINLMADVLKDIPKTYEIVIGGWGNRKSVIRKVKQGPPRAQRSGRFLDCRRFKTFFISWENNIIRVETPHTTIMYYKDPHPYRITGVSVSTGWGATGWWRVYNPDGEFMGQSYQR